MLATLASRPSATAAAEQALRAAIVSGELLPGTKLPPERLLSKQLGVSRLTLRAALATLAASGLIAVRHGSGYTVRDVRETGGTDLLPGLIAALAVDEGGSRRGRRDAERDQVAADVLRLRRHLAAAVLEAIVERPPSAAARTAIKRAIDRFGLATTELHDARTASTGPSRPARAAELPKLARPARDEAGLARLRLAELAVVEADLGIVRALLDATDSMILRVCLNPVIAVLRDSAPLRTAIYRQPETNLAGWRALGAWLEHPDLATIPMLLGVLAQRDHDTVDHLRSTRGAR